MIMRNAVVARIDCDFPPRAAMQRYHGMMLSATCALDLEAGRLQNLIFVRYLFYNEKSNFRHPHHKHYKYCAFTHLATNAFAAFNCFAFSFFAASGSFSLAMGNDKATAMDCAT